MGEFGGAFAAQLGGPLDPRVGGGLFGAGGGLGALPPRPVTPADGGRGFAPGVVDGEREQRVDECERLVAQRPERVRDSLGVPCVFMLLKTSRRRDFQQQK